MKSLFRILAVVMLTGALYSFTGSNMTSAKDPAVVISEFACNAFGLTFDSHTVITSSGNTTLICKNQIVNPTGKAVIFTGFACGTFLGVTNDSKFTISASGNVSLVCKLRL